MDEHRFTGLDESDPEVRLEYAIARAEFSRRMVSVESAAQLAAIAAVVREARDNPDLYLSAGFRGRDDERGEFASRMAISDLAVRLQQSESAVHTQAMRAAELQTRTPSIWTAFSDGEVSVGNAMIAAELAATLPPAVCPAFDAELVDAARSLSTPRFRERARRARERLDPTTLQERHQTAREQRRVWVDADRDGMCWFGAYLPAEQGCLAMARLDAVAASLAAGDGETRTLAQLRADVAADLLTGAHSPGYPESFSGAADRLPAVSVSVAVTVPVMTLLGLDELPATLEGYGPIDAQTARRLAAGAPSFQRILTHPITGTLLDIDRSSYRVPADLKRWTELRDEHCTFPGCGRSAKRCDLDHRTAWEHGGPTSAANLAHLCRHHHRLKHEGRWKVARDPGGGTTWTSSTGTTYSSDPPPF